MALHQLLLYTLLDAYKEFERRIGETASPRGAKTDLVLAAIDRWAGAFQVADLLRQCPSVGVDMIRRRLKELRLSGKVECLGRGRNAKWRKTAQWKLGNKS